MYSRKASKIADAKLNRLHHCFIQRNRYESSQLLRYPTNNVDPSLFYYPNVTPGAITTCGCLISEVAGMNSEFTLGSFIAFV